MIKVREKETSFKDAADISQWTANMEQLINWSPHFGETIAAIYDVFEDSRRVVVGIFNDVVFVGDSCKIVLVLSVRMK